MVQIGAFDDELGNLDENIEVHENEKDFNLNTDNWRENQIHHRGGEEELEIGLDKFVLSKLGLDIVHKAAPNMVGHHIDNEVVFWGKIRSN